MFVLRSAAAVQQRRCASRSPFLRQGHDYVTDEIERIHGVDPVGDAGRHKFRIASRGDANEDFTSIWLRPKGRSAGVAIAGSAVAEGRVLR